MLLIGPFAYRATVALRNSCEEAARP